MERELLEDFVDWLIDCGEDVYYVFETDSDAIEKFLHERNKNK